MTVVREAGEVRLNRMMLAGAVFAFVAGVVGYHWQDGSVLASLGLLAVGVLAALALALLSPAGKDFIGFSRESIDEAKRVVWPTRKETIQMTLVIFVVVFIASLFLWLTDKALEWVLYDLLLGWRD